MKAYWLEWSRLEIHDSLLYRRWESNDGVEQVLQLLLPARYCELMCVHFHDGKTAAHMGRRRTIAQVERRVYWPTLRRDVKEWIKCCDICQRRKLPGKSPHAPKQLFLTGVRNERVWIFVVR